MEYWKLYSLAGKTEGGVADGSGCKPRVSPFSHSIRGMRNDLDEPASRKRCNK